MKLTKEQLTFKIIEIVLYLFASLCFFAFGSLLTSMIASSLSNLFLFLPYLGALLNVVYLLFIVHLSLHPLSEKKREKTFFINGIILASLSLIFWAWGLADYIDGTYPKAIIGGITPLYPLDGLLLNAFLTLIGIGSILYGLRIRQKPTGIPLASHPGKIGKKIASSIFRPLFCLIALFFGGAIYFIPATFDTSCQHLVSLFPFYLLMLLPTVMLFLYEVFYIDEPDELRKKRKLFLHSIIELIVSLFLSIWLLIGFFVDPQFLSDSAAGLLPVDFMKSIMAGPFFLIAGTLSASLTALITSLTRKKHAA